MGARLLVTNSASLLRLGDLPHLAGLESQVPAQAARCPIKVMRRSVYFRPCPAMKSCARRINFLQLQIQREVPRPPETLFGETPNTTRGDGYAPQTFRSDRAACGSAALEKFARTP